MFRVTVPNSVIPRKCYTTSDKVQLMMAYHEPVRESSVAELSLKAAFQSEGRGVCRFL